MTAHRMADPTPLTHNTLLFTMAILIGGPIVSVMRRTVEGPKQSEPRPRPFRQAALARTYHRVAKAPAP